jgi:hypothetical protein
MTQNIRDPSRRPSLVVDAYQYGKLDERVPGFAITEVILRHPDADPASEGIKDHGLLDTGAERSMIRTGFATSLGLNPLPKKKVGGAVGGDKPRMATPYEVAVEIIGIGTWPLIEAASFEHPLPQFNRLYGVIIGCDILQDCTLTVVGPASRFFLLPGLGQITPQQLEDMDHQFGLS